MTLFSFSADNPRDVVPHSSWHVSSKDEIVNNSTLSRMQPSKTVVETSAQRIESEGKVRS